LASVCFQQARWLSNNAEQTVPTFPPKLVLSSPTRSKAATPPEIPNSDPSNRASRALVERQYWDLLIWPSPAETERLMVTDQELLTEVPAELMSSPPLLTLLPTRASMLSPSAALLFLDSSSSSRVVLWSPSEQPQVHLSSLRPLLPTRPTTSKLLLPSSTDLLHGNQPTVLSSDMVVPPVAPGTLCTLYSTSAVPDSSSDLWRNFLLPKELPSLLLQR